MNNELEQLVRDVGQLLREKGWTLCVAESVTVGRLQSLIGSVSGASDFFQGGITAYNLEQKVRHLGVARAEASASDCVSPIVCRQMGQGACALFDADLAIATTGYAEPDPDGKREHPFAYLSIWRADTGAELAGTKIVRPAPPASQSQASRRSNQQIYAQSALALLRDRLQHPADSG